MKLLRWRNSTTADRLPSSWRKQKSWQIKMWLKLCFISEAKSQWLGGHQRAEKTHTSHNTSLVFPEPSLPNCSTENSSQCVISSAPGAPPLHPHDQACSFQSTAPLSRQSKQADSGTFAPVRRSQQNVKQLPNSTSELCTRCFWPGGNARTSSGNTERRFRNVSSQTTGAAGYPPEVVVIFVCLFYTWCMSMTLDWELE